MYSFLQKIRQCFEYPQGLHFFILTWENAGSQSWVLFYIVVYDFEKFRQRDTTKCLLYRGVRIIEVGNV